MNIEFLTVQELCSYVAFIMRNNGVYCYLLGNRIKEGESSILEGGTVKKPIEAASKQGSKQDYWGSISRKHISLY